MKEYKGFLIDENLNFYSKRTGLQLKTHLGSDGYLQVQYRDSNGKSVHERAHIIVAHCFVPNPDPEHLKYVNHKDSDKTNLNPDNLEWCTNSYNVKHGWESGNRTHKNRTKVKAIDKEGNIYFFNSIRELGKTLNLDRHKVARILKGELNNHYDYEFDYVM